MTLQVSLDLMEIPVKSQNWAVRSHMRLQQADKRGKLSYSLALKLSSYAKGTGINAGVQGILVVGMS